MQGTIYFSFKPDLHAQATILKYRIVVCQLEYYEGNMELVFGRLYLHSRVYFHQNPIRLTLRNRTHKKFWIITLRLMKYALVIGVFLIAYHQVIAIWNVDGISLLTDALSDRWELLILCVLLMPLNWGIEVVKWHYLSGRVAKGGFSRKISQVLSGISFSIITPNRIGEYVGRLLHYSPQNQVGIVGMNIIGSLAQLSVTLTFGFICLMLTLDNLKPTFNISWPDGVLILIITSIVGVLFIGYLSIGNIVKWILAKVQFKWLSDHKEKLSAMAEADARYLLTIWMISSARYFVYAFQFLIMIYFMDIGLMWWQGLSSIALIYLIQSGVPLPAFLSLVVRSEVAVFIFGFHNADSVSVLMASYLQWLINLGIPAIIGLWPTLLINLRKTIGYESE